MMWKENWLVLALADITRVFGRLIQQGIILHTLLPRRWTEKVDWGKERRGKKNWGGCRREVGWWWLGCLGDD